MISVLVNLIKKKKNYRGMTTSYFPSTCLAWSFA